MQSRTVLVVGLNSSGKTCMINALTKQPTVANSEPVKCQHNGTDYTFLEKPALAGAVANEQEQEHKMVLLNDLAKTLTDNIDLIIFVTRAGTIHRDAQDLYKWVVKILLKKYSTPIICVVTGCENEFDMEQWAKRNMPQFTQNEMIFKKILATCFGEGGRLEKLFEPLREKSAADVWQIIEACCAESNEKEKSALSVYTTDRLPVSRAQDVPISDTSFVIIDIPPNANWMHHGTTIAGVNGCGNKLNQLHLPSSLYIADDQTLYIADSSNHRILEWRCDAESGEVVAGRDVSGKKNDQLNEPRHVIVDKQTNSLIICDYRNRRVVKWPRSGNKIGQIIIPDIDCQGLTMDDEGFLYVADKKKHIVTKYRVDGTTGSVVMVMGLQNKKGDLFDQFHSPTSVFVDRDHSCYVSDKKNHRVMKWMKDGAQGVVVAGGNGSGSGLNQLCFPSGVFVDKSGTINVADTDNHRIVRWPKFATQGSIISGGNGPGKQPNQLQRPMDLSFDREGNLYVADFSNDRIQRFSINRNT